MTHHNHTYTIYFNLYLICIPDSIMDTFVLDSLKFESSLPSCLVMPKEHLSYFTQFF